MKNNDPVATRNFSNASKNYTENGKRGKPNNINLLSLVELIYDFRKTKNSGTQKNDKTLFTWKNIVSVVTRNLPDALKVYTEKRI